MRTQVERTRGLFDNDMSTLAELREQRPSPQAEGRSLRAASEPPQALSPVRSPPHQARHSPRQVWGRAPTPSGPVDAPRYLPHGLDGASSSHTTQRCSALGTPSEHSAVANSNPREHTPATLRRSPMASPRDSAGPQWQADPTASQRPAAGEANPGAQRPLSFATGSEAACATLGSAGRAAPSAAGHPACSAGPASKELSGISPRLPVEGALSVPVDGTVFMPDDELIAWSQGLKVDDFAGDSLLAALRDLL